MDGAKGRELEQPLVVLKPVDMSPCKVMVALSYGTSLSHEQTCLLLQASVVLDDEFEIIMGSSENDIWDKIEATISTLKAGETGRARISLKPTVSDKMQSEAVKEPLDHETATTPCDKDIEISVTLLSLDYVPLVYQLSSTEKLSRASHYKDLGTKLFKADHIQRAFEKYSRALKYLMLITDADENDIKEAYVRMKWQCFLNMAACQMKCQGFDFVIQNCTEALGLDPQNVKALYRRALAFKEKKEFILAVNDLAKALEAEPHNRTLDNLLSKVKAMVAKDESNAAKAFSKMFT